MLAAVTGPVAREDEGRKLFIVPETMANDDGLRC